MATICAWLIATYVGWLGYYGSDDFYYSSYALKFPCPPHYFWEFRMPLILAMRAGFMAFGPTEFAASLPCLLSSLGILAAVAWLAGWPRIIDWKSQGAMFMAATLPLLAERRSTADAAFMAFGLLALGTACVLRGNRLGQFAGAVLFGTAFLTHEISLFYIGIFCLMLLAFDWRRFWQPVLACIVVSGCLVAVECTIYWRLLGDPLAHYRGVATATAGTNAGGTIGGDEYIFRFGGSKFLYWIWPAQIVLFDKVWGVGLILLFVSGAVGWRRLDTSQKILLATVFLVWFWTGYGTQVPWDYRPALALDSLLLLRGFRHRGTAAFHTPRGVSEAISFGPRCNSDHDPHEPRLVGRREDVWV